MEINVGIKNNKTIVVDNLNTAKNMKSGTLDVFATPSMIALIEQTCYESLNTYLDEGLTTVGININIQHIAPTPIGMKVSCESNVSKVDGRKISFEVNVFDEKGIIGFGTHERFIVKSDSFQTKANSKLNN